MLLVNVSNSSRFAVSEAIDFGLSSFACVSGCDSLEVKTTVCFFLSQVSMCKDFSRASSVST